MFQSCILVAVCFNVLFIKKKVLTSATQFSGAAASARRSDDGDSYRGSHHLFVCKWNAYVRFFVSVS